MNGKRHSIVMAWRALVAPHRERVSETKGIMDSNGLF